MQPEQDPLIGKRLERYQIVQRLGGGGMGAVYKARDLALQREVALKVLHEHYAAIPHFQERFLQEARTAARLDHPGIVKVFDFGIQAGILYIVMEFIPGSNLRQHQKELLAANTPMPVAEAVSIVTQVAEALDYAHSMGVFHRDIKPDNIMLKPRPVEPGGAARSQVIITDLGLAKLAEGGLSTIAGITLGTPAYMSPEQLQGKAVDERSDVYSLGVLLYEILSGRPPFPVNTLSDAIRRVLQEAPPPLQPRRGDLPEGLETVIVQALAKEPLARFESAGIFAQKLVEVLAQMAGLTPLEAESHGDAMGSATIVDLPLKELVNALEDTAKAPCLDYLDVTLPNGEVRSLPICPDFTIGRESDNDLVLADGKVSRHHARIEQTPAGYQVVDLGSSNGTTLEGVRLAPNTPQAWGVGQVVRIGEAVLRLRLHQAAFTELPTPRQESPAIPDHPAEAAPEAQPFIPFKFDASLAESQLSAPGVGYVVVANQDRHVMEFKIALRSKGDVLHFEPAEGVLRLNPGQQNSLSFTARPKNQPFTGQPVSVPYRARVTAEDGATLTPTGTAVIKPRFPVWMLIAVASLCLVGTFACLLLSGLL
jgi:serine/threonine protein kinase